MDPLTLSAVIKTGAGLVQSLVGAFKKKPKKPAFTASQGARDAVTTAQQLATAKRPGADVAAQEINQGVTNVARETAKVSGDSNKVIAAVNSANTSANNARNKESALNTQFTQQQQQALMGALQNLGKEQMQAKNMQLYDAQLERARKDALIGAGIGNVASGADDVIAQKINEGTLKMGNDYGKLPAAPNTVSSKGAANLNGLDAATLTNLIKTLRF